ncbi:DUF3015 family protein [Halopseudomonas sp.]|uniref:DUF3015 family protein n=1 Tax=Halopseudomonas sp. TaxID=2901191 RepID=UPI003002932A
MKMKLLTAAAVVACMSVAAPSFAQNKAPGSGPNPFVDCGIGAALFPTVGWAAVTSNVIWDIGTTAVTSATMSPETCSGKNLAAALFINDTYENLAEETAKGEGQHLTALLNILECDAARHTAAITSARASMAGQVSTEGFEGMSHIEKASGLYQAVDQAVSLSCQA